MDERFNYSVPFQTLSDFGGSGPLLTEGPGDSGIAFDTSFSDQFTFAYGYAVDDGQTVGEFGDEGGIGAGNNYHGFELGFIPSDTVGLYFQFATAYFQDATDPNITSLAADTVRGPLVTNDVAALIDDGAIPAPYGRLNAFSVAAEWQITPSVIFSGWGSFGNLEYRIPDDVPEYIGSPDPGDEDFVAWLVGFVFPDLFLEGGEGGFTVGQLPSGDLDGADKPLIVDVYYSLPINDFLNIVPSAYFITNPNGNLEGDNDPTIGVGAIRAEFNY
ncbi:MAG: carbohydrate porin [Synechococcaceae cyanobacterium SM2_3_1]|nr:carbohydrate porin [Synechococcaceae cyanobacterium SM2_3_1]